MTTLARPLRSAGLPLLLIAGLLVLLAPGPTADAWGPDGHEMVTRAAVDGLPGLLPPFFRAAEDRLAWTSNEPDRLRSRRFRALAAVRDADHYVDLELLEGRGFPPDRPAYTAMILGAGPLLGEERRPSDVGFGPYRVAELAEELVVHWALREVRPKGSVARAEEERAIVRTAGLLSHFVADLANPHHTTIHYNGWVGEENPEDFPTDRSTHARFEHRFVERTVRLADVVASMRPYHPVRGPFLRAAIRLTRETHDRLLPLYRLDRDGAFHARHQDDPIGRRGHDFASGRLAHGASVLRDLWVAAYKRGMRRAKDPAFRGRFGR